MVQLLLYNIKEIEGSQEKFLERRRQEDLNRIVVVLEINTYHDSLGNVFPLLLGLYGRLAVHGSRWLFLNQEFDEVDERKTNPTLLTPVLCWIPCNGVNTPTISKNLFLITIVVMYDVE